MGGKTVKSWQPRFKHALSRFFFLNCLSFFNFYSMPSRHTLRFSGGNREDKENRGSTSMVTMIQEDSDDDRPIEMTTMMRWKHHLSRLRMRMVSNLLPTRNSNQWHWSGTKRWLSSSIEELDTRPMRLYTSHSSQPCSVWTLELRATCRFLETPPTTEQWATLQGARGSAHGAVSESRSVPYRPQNIASSMAKRVGQAGSRSWWTIRRRRYER